ncbi:MAG: (2Fe-2S)-binding protein [Lysobacterales bacterium]|nr:MAG: (2Fe-2S)-binding protein [Xanthomonadales bacterium]
MEKTVLAESSTITLCVNGNAHVIDVDPSTPLLYVLRNRLGFKGAKLGCGLEQCGACAVLVNGQSKLTCVAPVAQFAGQSIVTIEGLRDDPTGAAVQRAFVDSGAAQCGYCTPGLVVAVCALISSTPSPSEIEMRQALQPHLCRCGSHVRVMMAVRSLAGTGATR